MPERFARFMRAATLLGLCSIAACSAFKTEEDTQVVVNRRLAGMSIGEFFDTFGPARTRSEQLDGTTAYFWMSRTGAVPTGFAPLDDAVCTLRVFADKRGKIANAEIVLDDPGQGTSSRCGTLFQAK